MTGVRIATQEDATEVGRVLTDGFRHDPVTNWVLDDQDRDHKLEAFFGFLAREALVPLGATYVLPGSCAAWTPPGTSPWPDERSERFRQLLVGTWTAIEIERLGILDEAMREHHPQEDLWYLSSVATAGEARDGGSLRRSWKCRSGG